MKYWRGYLIAAIIAAITWGINRLGATYSNLVDMVYPYLTRTVQSFLAQWSGGLDFCVWQVILVFLVLLVMASIVLMIVLRWNVFQWLGWVLTAVASLYFMNTCIYGLNQHAGALSSDIRLQVTGYTLEELEAATVYYRDLANEYADKVGRDASGNPEFPSFSELAVQAGEGFKVLTYDHSYSVFAGSTEPVKQLGWSQMYTSMGITGVTVGLTGEAAVNPETPAVGLPFTMCHEMAHRMCIAIDRDADFAAFLACSVNSSQEFRYSAYYMAYRYCYSALYAHGSAEATTAAARIHAEANANLKHDLESFEDFFTGDTGATRLAGTVEGTGSMATKDEATMRSYDKVTDLLVSWHIQEVVLPALEEEAVSVFDPYDESQVDLSGIVGALDKQPMEGEEE